MNYLQTIFDNIDEALLILTPEGEVLFFNEEATELGNRYGWQPLQLSESLLTKLDETEREKFSQILAEVNKTREPYQQIEERKGVDGSIVFTEASYIPAIEDGDFTHIDVLIRDVTVNKLFEKRLTGLATELRKLIDEANAIIIATDSRGYITEWNRHTRKVTGFTKNDVFTLKFSTLLLAEPEIPTFEKILSQVLDGHPVLNIELPVLSKQRNDLIFLLNVTPRTNSSGQVVGAIFVGQDITERRNVEQELKSAHERIFFHLENAPLGFLEWDSNYQVKSWSKRLEAILGWSEQEILQSGPGVINLVYKQDWPLLRNIADQVSSGEVERFQFQLRAVAKDGSLVWCECYNSVLKACPGHHTILTLVQDITERKKNELRLKEAQALAQLGNWEMNLRTKEVKWSEEAFQILGYTPDSRQPTLEAYLDVVHPADRENVRSQLNLSLETFAPQSFYHRINRKDGERTLFIVAQYEFDARQHPVRLFGTMMDVSKLVEKENKLKQAVKELESYKQSLEQKVEDRTNELRQALKKEKDVVEMKSRFVSIASHEFRTPLSTIQYNTNFIKTNSKRLSEDQLADVLAGIDKQVKHMMYLLDDVLTYGKSEAGKILLMVSRVKLADFIEKIMEEVGHSTKNTHAIEFDGTELPTEIDTDEKLLRNVLINLLTNAIKYSPGKNLVHLKVKEVKRNLVFIITDEGMGIPPEDRDRIFEAFVRGKSAESIQGTGLGLSIVKKAVELLSGTIRLESQVGQGTSFTVTIPII